MKQISRIPMSFLIVLSVLFVCCGPSKIAQSNAMIEADFKQAATINTEKAYNDFILNYPASSYVPEVKRRLLMLEEQSALDYAISQRNIESIDNFLKAYPNSSLKYKALNSKTELLNQRKIAEQSIKDEAAWQSAKTQGTIYAYQTYVLNFPNSIYVKDAKLQIDRLKQTEAIEEKEKNRKQDLALDAQQQKLQDIENKLWIQTEKTNTIAAYKKYLNSYPDGVYAEQAAEQIIVKEVDAIQKSPHGKLPAPQATGNASAYATTSEIEITNSTEYTLTVWYDGVTKKKIVLKSGEKFDIVLSPGDYRVAASVNAPSINPFAGKHTIKAGSFTEKFFIKTTRY
jgi:outer membrane protein assembly factor BamD (BamD/ComL family)